MTIPQGMSEVLKVDAIGRVKTPREKQESAREAVGAPV